MSSLDDRVVQFITQVTSAMGLSLEATSEETPDHLRVNLSGDGADVLASGTISSMRWASAGTRTPSCGRWRSS
jgi:hypothetical protein